MLKELWLKAREKIKGGIKEDVLTNLKCLIVCQEAEARPSLIPLTEKGVSILAVIYGPSMRLAHCRTQEQQGQLPALEELTVELPPMEKQQRQWKAQERSTS